MAVLDEVLSANEQYAASFGAKSELALPPARRFAILTCMDARLDPAKYDGRERGLLLRVRAGDDRADVGETLESGYAEAAFVVQ